MKKLIFFFLVVFVLFSCEYTKGHQANNEVAIKNTELSSSSIPVPSISYFQERRTIAKWAERWDQPNVPCFVYLFTFDKCVGYFVSDGKPASSGSFLTPEYIETNSPGGIKNIQMPDVDGTYGTNIPGVRFFTASGVAVEFGGAGTSVIYSDAPLPLNVPKLNE